MKLFTLELVGVSRDFAAASDRTGFCLLHVAPQQSTDCAMEMEMDNGGASGGGTSSLKHGEEDHGEEEFGLPGGAMDGTSRNSRCVQSRLREEYTAASYAAYRMRLSGLAADSL